MDKIYQLLKCLKENKDLSQRQLAKLTEYSLGMVNSLLKNMEEEEFIIRNESFGKHSYLLTEKGQECLENIIRERQMEKLQVSQGNQPHTAVILAAGENKDFDVPAAMLKVKNTTLMDRIIQNCLDHDIMKIIVIAGFQYEKLVESYSHYKEVTFIKNENYKWTGTMLSLMCAKDMLDDDFVLIEGDHIFEKKILPALLSNENSTCLLISDPRGSGDEAYVELNPDGTLFKISKDIHELNSIDAELTGIHKISLKMYQKMLKVCETNKNPYINYEYILEHLSRIYKMPTCRVDDSICMDIDNQKQYEDIINIYYPKLRKKEKESDARALKELFMKIMDMKEDEIISIENAGGMTNTNYKVTTKNQNYILRIPGKCTETMISRSQEKINGKIGYLLGLNVDTIFFDETSGIKISKYIENATTMTHPLVKLPQNMKIVAKMLYKLHSSQVELKGRFNVFEELKKYEKIMHDCQVIPYENYPKAKKFFDESEKRLEKLGLNLLPCHCDLVSENLIKDPQGRMYLIDWEYSGYNDPMWDLAAHFVECEFTEKEEEYFLMHYEGQVNEQKILLFKILQDVLWSAWTMAKEANGEDFGNYGEERCNRAIQEMEVYINRYEKFND